MRVFPNFPEHNTCPICGTNQDKECILAGISGTEDGGNMEAMLIHLDCIHLTIKVDGKCGECILYQIFDRKT